VADQSASNERTRIEVGFAGGQIMAATVQAGTADALEQALANGRDGSFPLEADDGRYTVVLGRVVYVKRFARESRVGFGGQ
jgi:hypothetical protein